MEPCRSKSPHPQKARWPTRSASLDRAGLASSCAISSSTVRDAFRTCRTRWHRSNDIVGASKDARAEWRRGAAVLFDEPPAGRVRADRERSRPRPDCGCHAKLGTQVLEVTASPRLSNNLVADGAYHRSIWFSEEWRTFARGSRD